MASCRDAPFQACSSRALGAGLRNHQKPAPMMTAATAISAIARGLRNQGNASFLWDGLAADSSGGCAASEMGAGAATDEAGNSASVAGAAAGAGSTGAS